MNRIGGPIRVAYADGACCTLSPADGLAYKLLLVILDPQSRRDLANAVSGDVRIEMGANGEPIFSLRRPVVTQLVLRG